MPKDDSHVFDPTELSTQEMYKLMIGSVVPRPIAWVSSRSKDGVSNLAPFSFFLPLLQESRQPYYFLLVPESKSEVARLKIHSPTYEKRNNSSSTSFQNT
ncbi:hypothetical protein [Geomicrobium sp. JCM 19055]|uniref:hypothetical protein n=1 Tax=Geomicrobium sp. JCM 19055 TaxID=1460649 RepID=UPI0026B7C7F5